MNCFEHFNQHRSLLFSIAYRMLGSAIDAEDMVQETFLRCQQASATTVQSPKTYLSTIVTRLCIDRLRSARIRREQYVGPWLPEPLIAEQSPNPTPHDPMAHAELAESLSFAFLTLLECLTPTERAIFLLREVFDYDYADIAKIVHKSIPNCRQIVRRARKHLILRRPSTCVSLKQKEELVEQFLANWNQGNVRNLIALMAEDVTFWSDGGGQIVAARKPLHGHLKVARFLIAIRQSKRLPRLTPQFGQINSQPGIVNYVDNYLHSTFSFEFVDGYIQTIFAVVNPQKLNASKCSI